jgi:hypothetical protein
MRDLPVPSSIGASNCRRRRFFLRNSLQGYFLLVILVFVFLSTALVLGDYYYYFGRHMASNLMDPALFRTFLTTNKPLLAKLFFFFTLVTVVGSYLSHAVAGPLHSLRRSFRIAAGGNLRHRMRIRHGDKLEEEAEAFNGMLKDLSDRVGRDREAVKKALRGLAEIEGEVPPVLREKLSLLKKDLEDLTSGFEL